MNVDGSYLEEDPYPFEEQEESRNQEENGQEDGPQNEQSEVSSSFPGQSLPKISDLVNEAILRLKKRKGSTVEGLYNYNYLSKKNKVDPIRTPQRVISYLKRAIMKGAVEHAEGEGASTRFKLTPAVKSEMAKAASAAASEMDNKYWYQNISDLKFCRTRTEIKIQINAIGQKCDLSF